MKKLFVGLVVAALFAPLSFAEEGKKKDSFFADVGTPTNFAMAIASTEVGKNTCYNQGDIGIDENGLILSCQSDGTWGKAAESGDLECNARQIAYGAPYNISKLDYGTTHWCPAGYSMVGFDTMGKDGRAVAGGSAGWFTWVFCCK